LLQEKAYEQSEKYKEGKYILERARMVKDGDDHSDVLTTNILEAKSS